MNTDADQLTLPIKRTEGETIEDRLTANAYHNILPARYLKKDADGEPVEDQEELFARVARNIALAEAVFEARERELAVTVTPDQLKPDHPRRDELAAEVFGAGTSVGDDVETELTVHNVNKFAYDTIVPDLPEPVREAVVTRKERFQDLMEELSFIPNSPTLMNAGDELQQLSACIAGHAPVYTREGLKRMDEVSPGDEVLTHRGRYREVLDHWSNGRKDTVEMRRGIERGSCFDTQLTPDHEVYTSDGRWVRADEVETPADPVFPADEAFPELLDLVQHTGRLQKQKDAVVDNGRVKLRNASDPRTPEFDQQNNQPTAHVVNDEDLAWVFGLYLAEGDVYGSDLRFTLGSEETALRDRLVESLERIFDIPVSISESSHGRWVQIRASSSFVADLFASVLGTGGEEKRIPTWVGNADGTYRQELLDGLLAGDGTSLGTGYKLAMANPTLVYETTLLARSLGYDAVFKLDKKRTLSSAPTSECYISTAENSRLSGVARRDAEAVEVYDMEVADDHSFVVGDFVVHNCFVDSPEDDLTDIHQTAKEAAQVFQCLTDDTSTYIDGKGVVSVADVEPGDEIVQRGDGDHRTRTVEETHAYRDAPVRRVETQAGFALTGTPNHELLVDGEWTRIDGIGPGDTLSVRLGWLPEADAPELITVAAGGQWSETRTVSNDEILELYAEGLSDYEIADRLDCSASTVQRRRANELGLDPNGTGGRPAGSVTFDPEAFERLHESGRTDGEIAAELGVSSRTVARERERRSLDPNGCPVKTVAQPSTLGPDLAELLGMWVGDGSKHEDGIRFHLARESNLEHADHLCRQLFDEGLDWRFEEGCYDAVLHSHEIKRFWLANFGDAKPDAPSASVPEPILRGDRETAAAFLRGLFSTDGSLGKDRYPRLWSASEDLVDGVQQLLLGLGVPATRWEHDGDDREYFNVGPTTERGLKRFAARIGFVDGRGERMREALDSASFRGSTVGELVDEHTWRLPVAAVEDAGTATVHDVTVAGDHEYLAHSVVSHNSGGGMGYAFWRLRPYGDSVGSTGGIASGPITFMETYDQLCFPPGTRVLTPSGQVPIEDLREGDRVVDGEGNERPVVETMERTVEEELAEITPKRLNRSVRATGEHPFRVVREGGLKWVEASDIEKGDQLVLGHAAAERGPGLDETIDLSTVASGPLVFTDGGIQINRDYYGASKGTIPSSINDTVPVADLATIAGWYLAEGCVVYRRGMPSEVTFTLHFDETEAAAEIQSALDSFDVPVRTERVEDRTTRIVHVESSSFAQFVEGLFGTGASEKRIPPFLWHAPVEVQARVLEALFDGDGRLQRRGESQRVQLKLANEELIDFVFQVGLRCGVQFSRHDREPDDRKETYSVTASVSTALGTPLEALFAEVPDDFRAVDRTKQAHGREVVEVDSVDRTRYSGPVYNVEVPESHSYVAEDLVVHNCETIAQGGARRGAQMAVMRVSHPDVIEFIHAKNKDVSLAHSLRLNDPDDYTYTTFAEALEEARGLIDDQGRVPEHLRNAVEGHLSNFNISVGVTDGFMEALRADEEYTFTNPRTGEPHVATPETEEMYERYGLGEHVEPGEELSIPARIVWDRIVEGAHENGEPGVIYLERVNKEHSFDVEKHPDHRILATNPSLAAGTRVLTDQGIVDIEELEGRRVEVPTMSGEWADAVCHRSGDDEPLYELELSNGKTYSATAEHKWPVLQDDGSYERTKTTDIEPGSRLPLDQRGSLRYGSVGDYDDGFLVGWLYGDGSVTHRVDGRTQYGFTFSEEDASAGVMDRVLDALEELTGVEYSPTERQRDGEPWYEVHASHAALRRRMEEYGVEKKTQGMPDVVRSDASESFRKGFVDGLFSADGYVDPEQNRIVLVSAKETLIKDVSDLLGFYGLKTSLRDSEVEKWDGTYDRWDLKLSRTAAHRFRETFELTHEPKSAALADLKTPDRDNVLSDNVTVEAVRETDESGPVWDLRVGDPTHTFALSHVFTGNCGEQPLEEYEACNLGHINLSTLAAADAPDWRVWRDRHGDEYADREAAIAAFIEAAVDVEELDRRIELGTRFLENVVTMSDFPVPEIERKVREMRKVGLGIMGLAQLYIQLGIRYGSEAGNELARQLMGRINHGSKWASHELAEERGTFAEWENSKYANPTEYREWFERQTGLDADDYAESGFKIRNHNTTTIAPTGTTSMVGNTTGGCEPIYNVAYYKNVSDDVQGEEMLVEFDDYFLRTLEANDIDVEAVKREAQEQMAANEFDGVDGLSTVPDAIGELFVVTGDLSAKQHAAVQCALQEGVDSAISKTTNAPNDSTVADAKDVFEYIYDHGGKGVTYYRDGTRSKQVLTTRAENTDFADMDDEEAVEAILDSVEELFGGLEGFLEHETVRAELSADVAEIVGTDVDPAAGQFTEKQPRPDVLQGVTQRIETGYGKVYITINEDAESSTPFELFANTGMSGGFTASFTEALAKSISIALRSGVDPEEIADKLRGIRSPKVAWDKGEQINSIPDAFGVALRRYLDDEIDKPYPKQQNLTELSEATTGEGAADGSGAEPDPDPGVIAGADPAPEPERETDGGAAAGASAGDGDATRSLIEAGESPECPECGELRLTFTEGCKTCEACGWSEC